MTCVSVCPWAHSSPLIDLFPQAHLIINNIFRLAQILACEKVRECVQNDLFIGYGAHNHRKRRGTQSYAGRNA